MPRPTIRKGQPEKDTYLHPPPTSDKRSIKRLRSLNEILKWVQEHPNLPMDPRFVNMKTPIDETGRVAHCKGIDELIEKVNLIKSTGVVSTLFRSTSTKSNWDFWGQIGKPPPKPHKKFLNEVNKTNEHFNEDQQDILDTIINPMRLN